MAAKKTPPRSVKKTSWPNSLDRELAIAAAGILGLLAAVLVITWAWMKFFR